MSTAVACLPVGMACLLLWVAIAVGVSGCSSGHQVKGRVVGIWQNEVTLRQEDDRLITVTVENARDVRVLDRIVVESSRARIKQRMLEDD